MQDLDNSKFVEVVFMMFAFLLFAVLGAIIVVFGVNNIIAPLVWFHKAEVAEENKNVFGKLIGTAKIIGGIGILLFSIMAFIDILTTKPAFFMLFSCSISAHALWEEGFFRFYQPSAGIFLHGFRLAETGGFRHAQG